MAYLPNIDPLTKALNTIDYSHHEIHEGSHFFYVDCTELASAAAQDYLLTTGLKYTHLSFEFEGSAITALDVYEASDKTGTTAQTIFNNDRNSAKASVNAMHKGTSGGTTDGTKIWCHKGGSATGASASTGVSSDQSSEIILKPSTKYIFRITSGTNGNLTNIKFEWYEMG